MKSIIEKNKVVILAFMSAIILVLQQVTASKETDWKVIGFSILTAVLGVMANQWKGKGITVLGILGNLAGVFTTIQATGKFTINEFILASLLALLTSYAATLETGSKNLPSNE